MTFLIGKGQIIFFVIYGTKIVFINLLILNSHIFSLCIIILDLKKKKSYLLQDLCICLKTDI